VDYMGPNVRDRIAPQAPNFSSIKNPYSDPRMFAPHQSSMTPMQRIDHTYGQVAQYNALQDQLFMSQALDSNFNPPFVQGVLDHPVLADMEAVDPFDEYAERVLKHNALFNLTEMRGPRA